MWNKNCFFFNQFFFYGWEFNKAKVVRKSPFTIKLTYDSTNYVQFTTGGMDTGTAKVGCAVIANDKVMYQSEIELRQDIKAKLKQRSEYRHTKRVSNHGGRAWD